MEVSEDGEDTVGGEYFEEHEETATHAHNTFLELEIKVWLAKQT